jgi:ABC-type Co2+ transport system permease subunit
VILLGLEYRPTPVIWPEPADGGLMTLCKNVAIATRLGSLIDDMFVKMAKILSVWNANLKVCVIKFIASF